MSNLEPIPFFGVVSCHNILVLIGRRYPVYLQGNFHLLAWMQQRVIFKAKDNRSCPALSKSFGLKARQGENLQALNYSMLSLLPT